MSSYICRYDVEKILVNRKLDASYFIEYILFVMNNQLSRGYDCANYALGQWFSTGGPRTPRGPSFQRNSLKDFWLNSEWILDKNLDKQN